MSREVKVGLVVVVALAGVVALLVLAGGGPGFLARRATIDVIFRDGQGVRVGHAVRVAGLDSGRVTGVDLAEVDGELRARVRLSVPSDLVARLRQDVKITVQEGLTGQCRVNIVATGRSAVALVPGQVVQGVETSMFDPILEQVGLGPVERSHLSHTIAEVRQTVDAVGPRCRQILGALQETASGIRETADVVRPAVETTVRRIDEAAPRIEATLRTLDALIAEANGVVAENRTDVRATLASLRGLSATAQEIAVADRPKLEALLVGLDGTRNRADRLLYQADLLTGQGLQIVTQHRADLERTIANVRDASGWGDRLVQKLYGNPFYLSPLYKPTPEDVHAQEVYDATQTFLAGARELHDAIKTLGALRAAPMAPADRQTYDQLFQRAIGLEQQLDQVSQRLADGLRSEGHRGKLR